MLLRRYISKRLADYYAQPSHAVVGTPSEAINFRGLFGEWHWRRIYKRLYEEQQGQWLTPIELFAPHFSHVLAEHCVRTFGTSQKFEIVEMGGGRGTNAKHMLNYLSSSHPDVYDQLGQYTIVDASPSLQELQKHVFSSELNQHNDKISFARNDLVDVAEENVDLVTPSNVPTLFLGLELLDNLGHDKVDRHATSRQLKQAVMRNKMEVFESLSDNLLKDVLTKVPSYAGSRGQPCWVPTVACGVLMEMKRLRPQSHLLLADFDYLPPPDLVMPNDDDSKSRRSAEASQEPLVTDMDGMDYECYLNAPHLVDILYPTDFGKLQKFCRKTFTNGQDVQVVKQSEFLQTTSPDEVRKTTSRWTGYSPMLEDFYNCSVLLVTPPTSES